MTAFAAIADDLTGACDVAAELALAGQRVEVVVAPDGVATPGGEGIVVVNTQSRALVPAAAAARVRTALRRAPASLVLKKIDTALRGHLGAELDAAVEVLGAPVFVLAAIPGAGRVTRDGCQWFDGRLLADTEFARDPEGPGAVSSIPAVIARESGRGTMVLPRDAVRSGRLAEEVARHRRTGIDLFVVDAEHDDDVRTAVGAIVALPRPVCLAGSIALAAALAPHVDGARAPGDRVRHPVPMPALIVNGSLHSRARAQVEAVLATGRAIAVDSTEGDAAAKAAATLRSGTTVVLAPRPSSSVPTTAALRTTETMLADAVAAIAARTEIATLVLIGGETSHAILTRLQAGGLAVHGRIAPLVAYGTILRGPAAGATLVTKGGSGGDVKIIAGLLAEAAARPARVAEGI